MSKTTFVFISGGCFQEAIGPAKIAVIDFDHLGGGGCPICGGTVDISLNICESCGHDWTIDDYESVMRRYNHYYKDTKGTDK